MIEFLNLRAVNEKDRKDLSEAFEIIMEWKIGISSLRRKKEKKKITFLWSTRNQS